jgi:hypothetical protein
LHENLWMLGGVVGWGGEGRLAKLLRLKDSPRAPHGP